MPAEKKYFKDIVKSGFPNYDKSGNCAFEKTAEASANQNCDDALHIRRFRYTRPFGAALKDSDLLPV